MSPAPSSNRKTNPADTQPGVPNGVRDHTIRVHIEVERATADHKTKQPTSREWVEVAAQFTSAANDTARMFERYLASLDDKLKELKPCLAKVNRTLERLEERLAAVVQPKPFVANGLDKQPRDVSTPQRRGPEKVDWGVAYETDRPPTQPTVKEQPSRPSVAANTISGTAIKQGIILRYFVKKSKDGTIIRGTYRKSGAQPTPLGERLGADGPDTDVSTSRGHSPERVDWGVAREADRSPTLPVVDDTQSRPSVTADTADDDDIGRESGAQPTLPGRRPASLGPTPTRRCFNASRTWS